MPKPQGSGKAQPTVASEPQAYENSSPEAVFGQQQAAAKTLNMQAYSAPSMGALSQPANPNTASSGAMYRSQQQPSQSATPAANQVDDSQKRRAAEAILRDIGTTVVQKKAKLIGAGYTSDEADAMLRQAMQAEARRQAAADADNANRQKADELARQEQAQRYRQGQARFIISEPYGNFPPAQVRQWRRAKLIGIGYSPAEADAMLGPA
jgi:hypothetical protein